MSITAVLIALFAASQNPTPKNCLNLQRALTSHAIHELIWEEPTRPTFDKDIDAIKLFGQTICKVPHANR